jgi:hypothetical protein
MDAQVHQRRPARQVAAHQIRRRRRTHDLAAVGDGHQPGRPAMLPPGQSAGAPTKEAAMAPVHEVLTSRRETERYRQAVVRLREVLIAFDDGNDGND